MLKMLKGRYVPALLLTLLVLVCLSGVVVASSESLLVDLQHYYASDFDGSFLDSVGSVNGVITNATYTSSGKINGAYQYNNDSYVTLGTGSDLPGTGDYSITGWFYLDTLDDWNQIITKSKQAYDSFQYEVRVKPDNKLQYIIGYTDNSFEDVETTESLTSGQWYFFVATVNGSSMKLYVNGTLKDSDTLTKTRATTTQAPVIGSRDSADTPDTFFDGRIDEVSYYNRTLSPAEVMELYNSGSGYRPVEYDKTLTVRDYFTNDTLPDANVTINDKVYYLDENASMTVNNASKDQSGNHNSMQLMNGTLSDNVYTSQGQNGWLKNSVDESVFDLQTFTISYWAKPNSTGNRMDVFSKGENSYVGSIKSNLAPNFWVHDGSYRELVANESLNNTEWAHITYVYNKTASRYEVYINGVLSNSIDPSGYNTLTNNGLPFVIGVTTEAKANLPTGNHYNGSLDDFIIYNRSLSTEEISKLPNGPVSKEGLVLYLPFDTYNTTQNVTAQHPTYYTRTQEKNLNNNQDIKLWNTQANWNVTEIFTNDQVLTGNVTINTTTKGTTTPFPLPPGTHNVTYQDSNYLTQQFQITTPEGTNKTINFTAYEIILNLTAKNYNQTSIQSFNVTSNYTNTGTITFNTTSTGTILMYGLNGTYNLNYQAQNYTTTTFSTNTVYGTNNITATLPSAGFVYLNVLNTSLTPLTDWTYTFSQDPLFLQGTSGSESTINETLPLIGLWSVLVTKTGYVSTTQYFTVNNTEVQNVTVTLSPIISETLPRQINVQDGFGQALQGALVHIKQLINGSYVTIGQQVTDIAGQTQFLLDNNVAYRVTITKTGYDSVDATLTPSRITSVFTYTLYEQEAEHAFDPWTDLFYLVQPSGTITGNQTVQFNFTLGSQSASLHNYSVVVYTGSINGTLNYSGNTPAGETFTFSLDLPDLNRTFLINYTITFLHDNGVVTVVSKSVSVEPTTLYNSLTTVFSLAKNNLSFLERILVMTLIIAVFMIMFNVVTGFSIPVGVNLVLALFILGFFAYFGWIHWLFVVFASVPLLYFFITGILGGGQ